CVTFSGVSGVHLIARVDNRQSGIETGLEDRVDMSAVKAEKPLDARGPQRPHDQFAAGQGHFCCPVASNAKNCSGASACSRFGRKVMASVPTGYLNGGSASVAAAMTVATTGARSTAAWSSSFAKKLL